MQVSHQRAGIGGYSPRRDDGVTHVCRNVVVVPVESPRRQARVSREGVELGEAGVAHQMAEDHPVAPRAPACVVHEDGHDIAPGPGSVPGTFGTGPAVAADQQITNRQAEHEGHEPAPTGRDQFIDFTRAFSLLVVVLWHWGFTLLILSPDGPHASNPIGFVSGLWMATWLLQVMPLFFFVGGYAHMLVWHKIREKGGGYWTFVAGRLKRLLIPVAIFLAVMAVLGVLIGLLFPPWAAWARSGIFLIASPLWFIAVYVVLVFLAPPMVWLHDRFGPLVVVFLVGLAGLVDIGRFHGRMPYLSLANLVLVWGCCHQFGFFYGRLTKAPRQTYWTFFWAGLFALVALTNTGLYPRSMVGVPGEQISNMGPPTLCILALCAFQIGVAMLMRPWVLRKLDEPRWKRFSDAANRFSMPLFLWHTTGYAIAFGVLWLLGLRPPQEPTWQWWALRPLYVGGALLVTIPLIVVSAKRWTRRQRARPVQPRPAFARDAAGRW